MLDHTLRRAAAAGLDNLLATRADARELPFGDGTFDGAYLVAVLGEVPPHEGGGGESGQEAALRELRRVVRPEGRIVVGELAGDPHVVLPRALSARAAAAGLRVERRVGPRLGCFTVLVPS